MRQSRLNTFLILTILNNNWAMKSKVRWKGSLYDLFSVVGEIELISK